MSATQSENRDSTAYIETSGFPAKFFKKEYVIRNCSTENLLGAGPSVCHVGERPHLPLGSRTWLPCATYERLPCASYVRLPQLPLQHCGRGFCFSIAVQVTIAHGSLKRICFVFYARKQHVYLCHNLLLSRSVRHQLQS